MSRVLTSERKIDDKTLKEVGKEVIYKRIAYNLINQMTEKELKEFLGISVNYQMIHRDLVATFKGSITLK